ADRATLVHLAADGVGKRNWLPLVYQLLSFDARQEIPQSAGELLARCDRFFLLVLGQEVEQFAAHRAMLDVGALVHPKEAQRLFVLDPVALDQAIDLRRGDCGELAFIGIERAKARSVRAARQLAESVD